MSSAEDRLDPEQRRVLLDLGLRSIEHGLDHGHPIPLDASRYDPALQSPRATFVTLHREGALRGCVGTLEVRRPLVKDVVESAFKAAFRDPRFAPLGRPEFEGLELHISVLSPLEPLPVASEEELLAKLRPGIDGLLIREGGRDGTFLPSVWDSLPDASEFVRSLKEKAGLPRDYWSDRIETQRYTVESIP
ncbi:MAG: AmmeMemoRadiSam system protein A [Myxococcota bacterium]